MSSRDHTPPVARLAVHGTAGQLERVGAHAKLGVRVARRAAVRMYFAVERLVAWKNELGAALRDAAKW